MRIFAEYLDGNSPHSIAEGLNRDGIPSPSGNDPERNPHRQSSHGAWSKSAIRAILRNPRYTGYEVWNKQRRDEVLLDVQDVALGNTTKMRWNPDEQWIWSEHPVHEAIIDSTTYEAVLARFASRTRDRVRRQRPTPRPYLLRGILFCGVCRRRMQGNWNNDVAHYRCRYPQEYALTSVIDHPKNVYLRQDTVVPRLDEWLTGMFDPANIDATCEQMAAVAMAGNEGQEAKRVMAERSLRECDRRLAKCRKLLYEGTDPKIVSEWISEVQAERLGAERTMATLAPAPAVTKDDVRRMVEAVEDKTRMLADADPITKATLYADLGITLTYEPDRRVVVVEAQPRELWAKERVGEGT